MALTKTTRQLVSECLSGSNGRKAGVNTSAIVRMLRHEMSVTYMMTWHIQDVSKDHKNSAALQQVSVSWLWFRTAKERHERRQAADTCRLRHKGGIVYGAKKKAPTQARAPNLCYHQTSSTIVGIVRTQYGGRGTHPWDRLRSRPVAEQHQASLARTICALLS